MKWKKEKLKKKLIISMKEKNKKELKKKELKKMMIKKEIPSPLIMKLSHMSKV